MSCELSYILLTPYTIARSRTGGVLSRLLLRLDLNLVGAQMIAPTEEFATAYADSETRFSDPTDNTAQLKKEYILKTFTPSNGRKHRVLLLLFKGENASEKIRAIAGPIFPERGELDSAKGETIRDTYGDIVYDKQSPDKIEYFEPVVITPINDAHCIENLQLLNPF